MAGQSGQRRTPDTPERVPSADNPSSSGTTDTHAPLRTRLREAVEGLELRGEEVPGEVAFQVRRAGPHLDQRLYVGVLPELRLLVVYAIAPVRVPESRRGELMELLTRANFGLRVGVLELDLSDGEVRARVGLDFEGSELVEPLVRNAILNALQLLDQYSPAILAVGFGQRAPLEALAMVEADPLQGLHDAGG